MDIKNRFHTNSSYMLVRAEHLIVVVACSVLALMHIGEINWWRFIGAFLIIDLVGYIPGAIVYHRQKGGPIPAGYHYMYNIMHSYITAAAWVGIWALLIGGFEWAMLALPIHLSGDRSIFGNIYKPSTLSFEPVPYAEYKQQAAAAGININESLAEGVLEN
ncbi:MAG: hypothetical protein OEZ39_04800 [Gammaproteobacteria bacterium]|nr:hypothetical protein [Gammaproteobacteria bacterium]MDH5651177.1 hypothetical protein [Gammaproteobacteria bacterium]